MSTSTTTRSLGNLCAFCGVAAVVLIGVISLAVLVWAVLL